MNTSKDQVPHILAELEEAFLDIPFENSDFQNRNFVVAGQLTPARAYRAIGLRLFAKIRAVKEYLTSIELTDIDIEENEHKMSLPETSDFEKRRLAIKNRQLQDARSWSDKLFNDAIKEISCLYGEFKKIPKYTREMFENEERLHFQVRLGQQLQLNGSGAAESLANMNGNAQNLEKMLTDEDFLKNLIGESHKPLEITNETVR